MPAAITNYEKVMNAIAQRHAGVVARTHAFEQRGDPTVNDDETKGFSIDSVYMVLNGDAFVCTDATPGAAVWDASENDVGIAGSHAIGGVQHTASTLVALNTKVSDATLDDSGDSRPPSGAASGADLEGTYPAPTLTATGVTPAEYIHPTLTVDAAGRVTAIANGASPVAHAVGGASHTADTLANFNTKISDATLDDSGDTRDPTAHLMGSAFHTADTLANLNTKVSDATLDDSGDSRPPTAHALGGALHTADTLANLNSKVSDATLDDSSDTRVPSTHSIAGSEHSSDTLANFNMKISDATLDTSSASRPPTAHASDHTDGTDDIQNATNLVKGLATAAQITNLEANTVHRTSDGSNHTFIDQSVVSGSSPTFDGANFSGVAVAAHAIGSATHTASTLAALNLLVSDATLDDSSATRTAAAHLMGSAQHTADTLANLNTKVSDATLDDASDPRTPSSHNLGGSEHAADTLANLNALVSDATLIDITVTTEGDILYRNGSGIARLARGSDGQVLKATATTIGWATDSQAAHLIGGASHTADTLANLNTKVSDATLIDTGDSRLSDARTPTAHLLGGAEHTADTLANLNLKVSDATLIDTGDSRLSDARTPTAHLLGGAEHTADTLANLNLKVSDATLVDTGDSRFSDARTPTAHNLGGAEHSADTLANLNSKVSDATLIDITVTTEGDILFRNGVGIARLPRGTNGQILTATATTIAWATGGGSGQTSEGTGVDSIIGPISGVATPAVANGAADVVFGDGASTTNIGSATNEKRVVFGSGARVLDDGNNRDTSGCVVIGADAFIDGSAGGTAAPLRAIVIGRFAYADNVDAIAIGGGSTEAGAANAQGIRSMAFGTNSLAGGTDTIAFGSSALANATNAMAFGETTNASSANTLAMGADTTVSAANAMCLNMTGSSLTNSISNTCLISEGLLSPVRVSALVGNATPSATTENNTHYFGDGSQRTVTLPTCAAGLRYTILVDNAAGMVVTAATGDTLQVGSTVTGTGGSLTSTTVGDYLDLVGLDATQWFSKSAVGGWA